MQNKLFVVALLVTIQIFDLTEATAPTSTVVPFELYADHFIVVEGSLQGKKLKLALDTGSSHTILQKSVAEELNLTRVGSKNSIVSFGKAGKAQRVIIRGLRFASAYTTAVCFTGKLPWKKIDALIGLDILSRYNFTIDFERREIQFGKAVQFEDWVDFQPGEPLVLVPARVGSRQLKLSIDTGAEYSSFFRDSLSSSLYRKGPKAAIFHAGGRSDVD